MLVGEVGVGGAFEGGAQDVAHGFDDVFLPEKTVTAAGAKIADAEIGDAAEASHFFPEFGLGAGVEDIEFEFAEALEAGASFQLADGGEGVDLPEGGVGPESAEGQGELAGLGGKFIFGELEIFFEPFEEGGFEDSFATVKGVAG